MIQTSASSNCHRRGSLLSKSRCLD
ncbi:hypothetical protein ID866_6610 [Astraeus odoratus]|nr:hypothetical protein ID866_6610 [Astraeus odoratus]